MILIDFSNQLHAAVHTFQKYQQKELTKDLLRHVILSNIFSLKKKVKDKGEIVLCLDSRHYWRKQFYSKYKSNRAKVREESDIDWDAVFKNFNELKEEFKSELPMKVMEIEQCEADDIIGVLTMVVHEPVVIISSDKDFIQLQELKDNVKQYSSQQLKWLTLKEYGSLFEKVLRGDAGDNIPNYLTTAELMESDTRCPAIYKKKIDIILKDASNYNKPDVFCSSIQEIENFNRNKKLIDLRETPSELILKIKDTFFELDIKKRSWFSYCANHRLSMLLENQPWR